MLFRSNKFLTASRFRHPPLIRRLTRARPRLGSRGSFTDYICSRKLALGNDEKARLPARDLYRGKNGKRAGISQLLIL